MTEQISDESASIIAQLEQIDDSESLLEAAAACLRSRGDAHRLFDVRMLQARDRLGLPLTQPASLDNVPPEKEAAFRDAWVAAARESGGLLLDAGNLSEAWPYFRTIGEYDAIQAAIEAVPVPDAPDDRLDEIINVALYEGAHVIRGLELLLHTHGVCNTITACTQLQQQMTGSQRRQAAALLTRHLTEELESSLRADLESRGAAVGAEESLNVLLRQHGHLLTEGGYHIDVSHLHSVVGFARALTADDPELQQAIDLCDYGRRLAEPLQYPGSPPFEQYYETHRLFLTALAGEAPTQALNRFVERMEQEQDEQNRQLTAFVVLDLGQRTGQTDRALAAVAPVLGSLEDPGGFSFTTLCVEQNHLELLEETARRNDDIVGWATAKILKSRSAEADADR